MSDYKYKLQEGTSMILNNLSEEYTKFLIEKALVNNNLKRVEDILPEDLISINENFRRLNNTSEHKSKKERSMSLIKLVGITYGMLGYWIYLYANLDTQNEIETMGFILMGLGIFSYLSATILNVSIIKRKQSLSFEKQINEYKLVEQWNEIERLSYLLVDNLMNIENNVSLNIPISRVIKLLYNEEILDINDVKKYEEILTLRNSIVHSTEKRISQKDVIESLKKAENLVTKLKLSLRESKIY